jgi:membrane protease YdiL (CAAX protease family)
VSEVDPSRRAVAHTFARIVAGVLGYLAVGVLTGRALGVSGTEGPLEPQILAHGAGCAGFCVFAWCLPPRARLWPPRGALHAPGLYGAFLLAWVPGTMFGYAWLLRVTGADFPPQPHLQYFASRALAAWPSVLAWATVVVVGPLAEEFAFRGYLRDLLHDVLGPRAGLWLTSVLFGLFHGVVFALPLTLLGLLFGWLRERYDSLAPAFVAHALHNGLTVGITMTWPEVLDAIYR